mgnify:FL=1
MRHLHIISNENIKEYETLLELYKNKDFSTVRNEKEKEIEEDILKELIQQKPIIGKLLANDTTNYLSRLNEMDSTIEGFPTLINTMQNYLQTNITIIKEAK